VREETGFDVHISKTLAMKNGTVQYFEVEIVGGQVKLEDPDELIYEVAWKKAAEIKSLKLT
jgi:hypothetical protein